MCSERKVGVPAERNVGTGANRRGHSWPRRLLCVVGVAGGLAVSGAAGAVDGCKVLLCLAAPNGWRSVSECVPPMEDLLKSLALGHSFPSCSMAGNPSTRTGSFASPMPANYYDQCPAGMNALPSGSYAIMSSTWVPADNSMAWAQQHTLYAGIGDGAGLTPSAGVASVSMPPEVCVSGAPIGQVDYAINLGPYGFSRLVVPVYSSVTLLQANSSPNVIGVWIDGALYNQVHW